jgi:hypothetical protein
MTKQIIKIFYAPFQKIGDDFQRKRNRRLMMAYVLKIKTR